MLTFKDEDLGLTYTVETIEDLESAIRLHQAIHHTMQEASADLKVQIADVVKDIHPVQTPFMGARQIYPSSFTNGLGAGKSIEQGDEGIPLDSSQWLSPRQISEPLKGSPDAETEALAEAYQLQEHRQLQAEVMRLREGYETRGKVIDQLRNSLKESELAIEFVDQPSLQAAYAPPLYLQQAEQQAKTQMVKEQLETILALNHAPSKADVRMFQLWERFLEIMDANGFGDTPGEDRTSPDSYLSALEKWLAAFVQASEQLQEERRKSAHLLHEKENCQRQVQVFGAQADGMRNELGECKAEIVALKKGISKLQKKRDNLKSKHEAELSEAISNHGLCKAELKRIGDLYREMQDQRDQERKMREDAINDNIELSKRSNVLQKKLDYCLKVVPTLEAAWQNIQLGVSAPT